MRMISSWMQVAPESLRTTHRHRLELASSLLGFLGAAILSLDALFAVARAQQKKGKTEMSEAAHDSDASYADHSGHRLPNNYSLQMWFARNTRRTAWTGFSLVTLSFLLDFILKW